MARWVPHSTMVWMALAVGLLALSMSACAPPASEEADNTVAPAVTFTDFATLRPPDSPNNWLVGPSDFAGQAQLDETAPAFDVPAATLADSWRQVIRVQPRTGIVGISEDGLRIEAEQKSAMFGFTDRVSVQVLQLDAARSTFVAYSTSLVGKWDLGANRSRLRDWIGDLTRRTSQHIAQSR